MKTVSVVMTCFNRKKDTLNCIRSLVENNPSILFHFFIVDDCSTDGTKVALEELPYYIQIISGNGNLFWNGGMHLGLDFLFRHPEEMTEYIMLVNDDVVFLKNTIEKLLALQGGKNNRVCVGTMCNSQNELSYGGIKFTSNHFIRYYIVPLGDNVLCDTFNCNCVLLKKELLLKAGNLDVHYKHSMGDFDYGLYLKKMGVEIMHSKEYTGVCDDNHNINSWNNKEFSRIKRIKLKESPKGLPFADWFYFGKKNYGIGTAVYHAVTPYIKILLKR